MEVEGDERGVEHLEEALDGFLELGGVEGFGEVSGDLAIAVVLDAHAVAEGAQEVLVSLHEPDLQKVLADHVLGFEAQNFVHPGDLVRNRFFLEEDEAEFASLAERRESGLVETAFFGAHPHEHVLDEGGIDVLVEFVGFHVCLRGRELAAGGVGCKRESGNADLQRERDFPVTA